LDLGKTKELRKYTKNHSIVAYEKLSETSVTVLGKTFLKRQPYLNGYYFECVNGRKNEHIKGSRENNCSGRIFIEYPLQGRGVASQTKDHSSSCVKSLNSDQLQNTLSDNTQDDRITLLEIIREIIKKDPTIKNRQIVKEIKEKFPKKYPKIMPDDVKYLAKQIKGEMDYNTSAYAFKNTNTLDDQPFLRAHGLSYI